MNVAYLSKITAGYDYKPWNDVETQNHYAIRVKVVQQFLFLLLLLLLVFGGGVCIIFIWSRMKKKWIMIMSVDLQSDGLKKRETQRERMRGQKKALKGKAYSETGLDFRKISMVFRVLSFRKLK